MTLIEFTYSVIAVLGVFFGILAVREFMSLVREQRK